VSGTPVLEVRGLGVRFGEVTALQDVTVSVGAGEVVGLLGPSGSGKSTLLHAVAGFRPPDAGEVWLRGRCVAGPGRADPPERREVGVVFQSGALWPHLSVLDTVAYPLRRRRTGRDAARQEALRILDRLNVAHLAGRRPAQLSGGEAQRVGLARALARRASLYLFDEPTANLDTHVRGLFLAELAERQRGEGIAALYATHDAEEALGLADRVMLLHAGRVVQVGTPQQVYDQPVDLWAARLTGPSSALHAAVEPTGNGAAVVTIAEHRVRVTCSGPTGEAAPLLVRPGWAHLGGELPRRLDAVWFRGPHSDHLVETPAGKVLIRSVGRPAGRPGEQVRWSLLRIWPLQSSAAEDDRGA